MISRTARHLTVPWGPGAKRVRLRPLATNDCKVGMKSTGEIYIYMHWHVENWTQDTQFHRAPRCEVEQMRAQAEVIFKDWMWGWDDVFECLPATLKLSPKPRGLGHCEDQSGLASNARRCVAWPKLRHKYLIAHFKRLKKHIVHMEI